MNLVVFYDPWIWFERLWMALNQNKRAFALLLILIALQLAHIRTTSAYWKKEEFCS